MRVALGIALVFLFLAGAFFGLIGVSFAVEGILPGVHMGAVDLGGLNQSDAEVKLRELRINLESLPVHITYGDDTWQASAAELGYSLDVTGSLEQALQVGNSGSVLNRLAERQRVKHHGLHIKPVLKLDRQQFESQVTKAWQNVITEPENAGFKVLQDDRVAIVPGRMGTGIDFDALEKEVAGQITAAGVNQVEVFLPVMYAAPLRSTQDIESMDINGLIARYSTRFDAGQAGRTYNIRVAAAALDGQLIAPGDVFSFNRVVGPRSSETGYKSANVIINNELVPGVGGGVCQVSSTLYNAVLLANLEIVERSNHSLPVSYVPIGRDATVVYGAVDFKFTNNTDFHIYMKSEVTGNNLTVKLYGNTEKNPRVELSSWVVEKIEPTVVYEKDPNLASGEKVVKQEGTYGFKAAAVRYVWTGGKKTEEPLPQSLYNPVRRIVAIGTGIRPTVIVPLDRDIKLPVAAPPQTVPSKTPADGEEDDVQPPADNGRGGQVPDGESTGEQPTTVEPEESGPAGQQPGVEPKQNIPPEPPVENIDDVENNQQP